MTLQDIINFLKFDQRNEFDFRNRNRIPFSICINLEYLRTFIK